MALLRQVGLGRPMTRAEFDENMNEFPNKFASIAALKAATWLQIGQVVTVEEYHAGVGGGMLFGRIVAGGTGTDDGGSYIDLPTSGLQFEQNFPSTISVKMFGAKGDGVTDDTSSLSAARDYIQTKNFEPGLYFNDGDYLITTQLDYLHKIKKSGVAALIIGGDIFNVSPTKDDTNKLYVSNTGIDDGANSGIDSLNPISLQAAFNRLKEAAINNELTGFWEIHLSSGTYTNNFNVTLSGIKTVERVKILGAATSGHPDVPTTIFDGTGAGDYQHGIRCGGVGLKVWVQDIKFQNYDFGSSCIGLVGENEVNLYTQNIHADNCSWCGIYAFNTTRARVYGGIYNGCRSGVIVNSTQATVYGSAGNPLIISNSTESGLYWSRGSQGHSDYIQFNDNAVGLIVAENARVDTIVNEFYRNTVGIRTQTGGVYGEGGITENIFGVGVDANTTDKEYKAFSGDTTELGSAESYLRVSYDRTTRTHSGSGATDIATVYTLTPERLSGVGKSLKVKFWATLNTITVGSTVGVKFGGMTLNITAPAAASNLTAIFEFELHDVGGGYRSFGMWQQGLGQFRIANTSSGFDSTISNDIIITANLAGVGDTMNIYRTNVEIIG